MEQGSNVNHTSHCCIQSDVLKVRCSSTLQCTPTHAQGGDILGGGQDHSKPGPCWCVRFTSG